jgi:O-antigen/teichoic acid export membrane protein
VNRTRILAAGSNWLAFAAALAVSFVLTPVLVRALGTARYDVWCVAEAILAWFTLLDMGLAVGVVRQVARGRALADYETLNRHASATGALFSAAGLIALAVGVPVMLAAAPGLAAKSGSSAEVMPFLLLMLFNVAVTLPLSLFPSILDGLELYTAKSLIRIGCLLVRTAAIVASIQREPSLVALAVILTVSNLVEHALMIVLVRKCLPQLALRRRHITRTALREVRLSSLDAFLAMLAGRMTLQTGVIVIGLMLPGGQATIFTTATRLVEYAKTLLRTITATITPGVSALEAQGDWPAIRTLFLSATKWMLIFALPVNFGLWLFGGAFLARWVPEVGVAGVPTLAILAVTLALGVAQSVAARILYGLGSLRLFARLAIVEAVINLAMLVSLIGPFGLEGVALALAVPNAVFCIAVIAITCRRIGVSAADYARAWRAPLAAVLLPAAVWLAMPAPVPHWSDIALRIAAGLVPYAVGVVLLNNGHKLLPRLRHNTFRHFANRP